MSEKVLLALLGDDPAELDEQALELERLVDTAGGEVIGSVKQTGRKDPDRRTYFGSGKLQTIASAISADGIDTLIINSEISPSQQRNIEQEVDAKVVDRTNLILDIFARHAHTADGKLQVELAQLNYRLPRLRGRGVELSRIGGASGGIATKGPGETKLEVDRRRIESRIARLKKELLQIKKRRDLQRKARTKRSVPTVSLVGYTNAGKSSLINQLTGSQVLVQDILFATLDATTKRLKLKGTDVLITDTVGFISSLPHQLVEAFKSTLEEIKQSWLLLHVIDASNEQYDKQKAVVEKVLSELGVADYPIINVFNKSDQLSRGEIDELLLRYPDSIVISAAESINIEELKEAVIAKIGSIKQPQPRNSD